MEHPFYLPALDIVHVRVQIGGEELDCLGDLALSLEDGHLPLDRRLFLRVLIFKGPAVQCARRKKLVRERLESLGTSIYEPT